MGGFNKIAWKVFSASTFQQLRIEKRMWAGERDLCTFKVSLSDPDMQVHSSKWFCDGRIQEDLIRQLMKLALIK